MLNLFLGLRVYEVLEKLYKDLKKGKKNTLDNLLNFLNEQWETKWNESITIVKKEFTQNDYIEKTRKYIMRYYQRYAPFDQGRTLGIKKRILIILHDS
jgi:putative RecB family exonuclease